MAPKGHGLSLLKATELFGLLADPSRLRIVLLLAQAGKMHGQELCARLGLSQPVVSGHLGRLRLARVVEFRRKGHRHYYRLSAHVAADLLRFFSDKSEPERPGEGSESPTG
jgi:DNA-binding transcriptional ArsR family regulator